MAKSGFLSYMHEIKKKTPSKLMLVGFKNLIIDEYGDFWYYINNVDDNGYSRHRMIYIPIKHILRPMTIFVNYHSENIGDFSGMTEIIVNYSDG